MRPPVRRSPTCPRPGDRLDDERQPNSWIVDPPGRPPRLHVTRGLLDLLDAIGTAGSRRLPRHAHPGSRRRRLHPNLGDDENRFNPDWVGAVSALLDEVAAAPGPRALVTTATGKIWSNGLDLEWMGANTGEVPAFVPPCTRCSAQMLGLPVPTVAAIQGHCFAAGAMLAVAHDFRVMRADRGFFCLPEVDIHIPFTPPMAALIQARLSKAPRTRR